MADDKVICRICYADDSEEPLSYPCKCSGTQKFIHQSCWERVLEHQTKKDKECRVCRYPIESTLTVVNKGIVTWSIFFQALGKYLLSPFFFVLRALPLALTVYVAQFDGMGAVVACLGFNLLVHAKIERDASPANKLPPIGKVYSKHKIAKVSSWEIIKYKSLEVAINFLAGAFYLLFEYLLTNAVSSMQKLSESSRTSVAVHNTTELQNEINRVHLVVLDWATIALLVLLLIFSM
uniref:RING-CH-type domain-containing protein n=1 Tax=Steinernema glaseri TaxID=37863 RepID=A0A1I8A9V1_9BILA